MSAEDIYQLAKKEVPSIAVGTVYRNLRQMVEAGEIRCIPVQGAPDRYDKTTRNHAHLLCDICGVMRDATLPDLLFELSERTGEDITYYNLNLHYICEKCRKK